VGRIFAIDPTDQLRHFLLWKMSVKQFVWATSEFDSVFGEVTHLYAIKSDVKSKIIDHKLLTKKNVRESNGKKKYFYGM
jgi:hypothetical protein